MGRQYLLYLLLASLFPTLSPAQVHHFAQAHSSEQVEVSPPPVRRAEPPPADAAVAQLEARGDTLRSEKFYLDALDYYRAALKKEPDSARLYNKTGINELQMARFGEASKDFQRAIKNDRQFADAYNNLGVIYYLQKKYGKAIKEYEKAIIYTQDSGSFFSNLGAAYFSKKDYVKASLAYNQALQLDPDIFERTSHTGRWPRCHRRATAPIFTTCWPSCMPRAASQTAPCNTSDAPWKKVIRALRTCIKTPSSPPSAKTCGLPSSWRRGRWPFRNKGSGSISKSMNHKGHEGSRRKASD